MQILEQEAKLTFEELSEDVILRSAVERNLQVAIQSLLDIGTHIIAEMGFELPDENKDIFRILGDEGILPTEFADRIKGMAGFRNILVHGYIDVDFEKVYHHLTNDLKDFKEFAHHVVNFLEKLNS